MLNSPGRLWGRGKGQLKKGSAARAYCAAVKSLGRAFIIGDGSVAWSWSATGDLGDAMAFLMEQAMMGGKGTRERVSVNAEGCYYVKSGDVSMVKRAEAVSKRLGLGDVESVPDDDLVWHTLSQKILPVLEGTPLLTLCTTRYQAIKDTTATNICKSQVMSE